MITNIEHYLHHTTKQQRQCQFALQGKPGHVYLNVQTRESACTCNPWLLLPPIPNCPHYKHTHRLGCCRCLVPKNEGLDWDKFRLAWRRHFKWENANNIHGEYSLNGHGICKMAVAQHYYVIHFSNQNHTNMLVALRFSLPKGSVKRGFPWLHGNKHHLTATQSQCQNRKAGVALIPLTSWFPYPAEIQSYSYSLGSSRWESTWAYGKGR